MLRVALVGTTGYWESVSSHSRTMELNTTRAPQCQFGQWQGLVCFMRLTKVHSTHYHKRNVPNRGLLLFSFWKRAESDCLHTRLKGG